LRSLSSVFARVWLSWRSSATVAGSTGLARGGRGALFNLVGERMALCVSAERCSLRR